MPRAQCVVERRCGFGLDRDQLDATRVPGRDSLRSIRRRPTATSNESRIQELLLKLHAHGSLPKHRLRLIIGVDLCGSGFSRPFLACRQRIRIAIAGDDQFRAVSGDAIHLGGRSDAGHKDGGGLAQFVRRVGYRRAVIPTRCRYYARC